MTTYAKVNVPLPGGVKLPSLKLGASGASIVLSPAGLSATGSSPAVWTEDISGTALTGTTSGATGTSVVAFSGQRAMQSGTTTASYLALNAVGMPAIPLTGFTVALVVRAQGYAYHAQLGGGYKIGVGSTVGAAIESTTGGLISAPIPSTAGQPVVVVAQCNGTSSNITTSTGARSDAGTNPIKGVGAAIATPVVGRSGANQTTQIALFALWPRVLSTAEVTSVVAHQRENFAGVA